MKLTGVEPRWITMPPASPFRMLFGIETMLDVLIRSLATARSTWTAAGNASPKDERRQHRPSHPPQLPRRHPHPHHLRPRTIEIRTKLHFAGALAISDLAAERFDVLFRFVEVKAIVSMGISDAVRMPIKIRHRIFATDSLMNGNETT
ncbi:hypothetical protein [Nonomuraea jiangxiensis]|uniref:hypothetical protein n=1 Tax=Nonomuraea jiangxiensis TaxID=633440 RepID=UPI00115FDD52|nr:hypothetical protein [Nonomuraea jiangxiensis]